ncbi:MAG: hypothetical protein JNG88_16705 [Phycisphaerales bacterium]|nr:hypothetical protein [Phycisphaerales bacterium]
MSLAGHVRWIAVAAAGVSLLGCHKIENNFAEDGPSSSGASLDSATVADLRTRGDAPEHQRERAWKKNCLVVADGSVRHAPLYFQDPFEDKGAGYSEHRMGWEDIFAAHYNFARFTGNWLLLPVSMVINPPWQTQESDGILSTQLLGKDHDPEPVEAHHESEHDDMPHSDDPAQ